MVGPVQTTTSAAEKLLGEGKYQEAVDAYNQAISQQPADAALYKGAGEAYDKLGQNEAALASFRRASELDPNSPEIHYALGRILTDEDRYDEAEASYRQAILLKPDFVIAHARLGYLLDDIGQKDQARKEYALVELAYQDGDPTTQPDDPDLYADFGRVLAACQRPDDAARAYTRAAALYKKLADASPHDPDLFTGLGFVLDELGRAQEAADAYQRAIDLRPRDGVATFNRGVVLEHLGDVQGAVAAYRRAVELSPQDPDTYAALGAALGKAGRCQEAEDVCRKAITMRDDNADAWAGLAIALSGQEQYPQAEQAFNRSLTLEPDPDTARRFVQMLVLRERPEDADAVAAQQLDTDVSWQTFSVRAAIDLAFGDKYRDDTYYDDCVDKVTEALTRLPPKPSNKDMEKARLFYQRASAYSLMADYGKAKADFQKCIACAERNSSIALSAIRYVRRINSRSRRSFDVPAPLPYLVTVLALAGVGYGVFLVERGKLSAAEFFPLALGLVLVIFAFSLPSITSLKLGPAELDKQVVVVNIPPPEKLK